MPLKGGAFAGIAPEPPFNYRSKRMARPMTPAQHARFVKTSIEIVRAKARGCSPADAERALVTCGWDAHRAASLYLERRARAAYAFRADPANRGSLALLQTDSYLAEAGLIAVSL